LPGLPERGVAHRSVGEEFSFFAEASGFFCKAFFKGNGLFRSSARLHGDYRVLTVGFEFRFLICR
jgi:hypothetical protein